MDKMREETITPELAKEYLKKNTKNRSVSEATVRLYADSMKRGIWKFNGDSIRFGKSGVLLDGQHRLLAIVKSGIPIKTYVCYDIDDDAFTTIDQGNRKTAGQLIGSEGFINSYIVSSIVKARYNLRKNVHTYDNANKTSRTSKTSLTCYDVVNLALAEKDKYQLYAKKANVIRHSLGSINITPTTLCAVWMHIVEDLQYPQSFVDYFFEALTSNETAKEPVLNQMRLLIVGRGDKSNMKTMQYKMNMLFKAFNRYARGENNAKLSWSAKEGNIDLLPYKQ